MTVPHERARAIGWGKEMLTSIQEDDSIPAALRARAHEIDPGYPTALALRGWLTAGKNGLPAGWATSIGSAYELFIAVQLGDVFAVIPIPLRRRLEKRA